jgi:beta-glucanase (GH16 family)
MLASVPRSTSMAPRPMICDAAGLAAALILICIAPISSLQARSHELDIAAYRETFSETFRQPLDVTAWGPSKWIAHTPWHGDFGDARFCDPRSGFPFVTGPNGLTITARKAANGKWESGLLSSTDGRGNGFAQAGGYFEARMKMPAGPGVWPAFWLVADADPTYKAEVDIVEYYGHATDRYEVNLHLWPKSKDGKAQGQAATIPVQTDALTSGFHTYAAELLEGEIVFYLDRREVKRMPTSPAMSRPMAILVNLALGSGWPIDQTPDPSVLAVDYVKAFAKKGT